MNFVSLFLKPRWRVSSDVLHSENNASKELALPAMCWKTKDLKGCLQSSSCVVFMVAVKAEFEVN